MKKLLPIIFLLPLIQAGVPTGLTNLWETVGWQGAAIAAVFLSIFFVSIGYMFGIAFRQPQLTLWAKNELYQALASAALLALIIGFIAFFVELGDAMTRDVGAVTTCTLPGPAGEAHMRGARCIVEVLLDNVVTQMDQALNINMRIAALAALQRYLDISYNLTLNPVYPWRACNPAGQVAANIPGQQGTEDCAAVAFGIGYNRWAGVSMFGSALNLFFTIGLAWAVSLIAQSFFLRIIGESLFPATLVAGLILRTFFFTRRIGGLLIAIAIGLYTVYPMMYIIFAADYQLNIVRDEFNPIICTCKGQLVNPYAVPPDMQMACPMRFCTVHIAMAFLPPPLGQLIQVGETETAWLFPFFQNIGALMVPALFIPFLAIFTTIAFIKGLSPFLGGDVEIAGLTHLL